MTAAVVLLCGLCLLWAGRPSAVRRGALGREKAGKGLLLALRRAELPAAPLSGRAGARGWRILPSRRPRADQDEQALWPELLQQMAALLQAGTSPARVWTVLHAQRVRAAEDAPTPWAVGVEAAEPGGREPVGGPAVPPSPAGHGQGIAADVGRLLAAGARASAWGLDPVRALEDVALGHPRSVSVRNAVRAAWAVSARTGAPLAEVLRRLADAVEDDIDADAARATALAGPTSTAKILTTLPALGLGLGILMGTDPFGVLLGQVWGHLALGAGIVLAWAGHRWTRRLIRDAEGEPS